MRNQGRMRVKICGIVDVITALAAVEAGADGLGFVFAPSRRQVTPEKVRQIVAKLPPFVDRVGVFVNMSPNKVMETAYLCGLTTIQLSGDEGSDYLLEVEGPYKIIKGFRVRRELPLPDLNRYQADAFLFDTFRSDSYGGTGEVFNWEILRGVDCHQPLILAGGLNPANIQEAISKVRPYAVDVSGGVETSGQKDVKKMKQFIKLAKEVIQ